MTKQEAIETIKLALSQVEWDYPLDYAVAFDIAISAMEKQDVPDICVGDMISRQNAIDAICKACSMEGDYHKCDGYPETSTWCDELVALRALPSAQPEQRWIPVSERLPEKGVLVFVTVKRHECDVAMDRLSPKGFWRMYDSDVTAWMPLPEPYEREDAK